MTRPSISAFPGEGFNYKTSSRFEYLHEQHNVTFCPRAKLFVAMS